MTIGYTGTSDIGSLVNAEEGLVSRHIFSDPGVYELELERVFARCWQFLGHESQIRRPGDFFSAYLGEDPVLVGRQDDGSIAGFLNVCRHRGMRICKLDAGNAPAFRESYLDLGMWREDNPEQFNARREEAMAKAASAEGRLRDVARLDLAQLYLGNQLSYEAIGVLDVLESELKSDDLRKKIHLVRAIADTLAARPKDALSILGNGTFPEESDALMWRTIARADAGDFRGARSDALAAEASQGRKPEDVFMTAISPNNLEFYHRNGYYPTDEQHLEALANAMNVEYRAIVDAGFVLQVDDPRMATHYNRTPDASIEECRRFIAQHVEAVNLALKGIPRERVRFHTCYSVNVAPRVHDMELRHYIDLMLRINAAGYTFEGANPRHDHEWTVWKDLKLPDHKVLIPGVVSHCVQLVEHPELVAQRIERYASVVGRERVIASNDCGFATAGAGDEVHPQVAWAKMKALVEGSRIASRRLWAN